jgi:DNA-binding transcriptional ArsR family regulator
MVNRMVEYGGLDHAFGALADPSRRRILAELRGGERRVTDLARPLPMSLNAASKHIKVLERAGLVRRRVSGRDHYLTLAPEPLGQAAGWLEPYRAFWEPRLDALEDLLRAENKSG